MIASEPPPPPEEPYREPFVPVWAPFAVMAAVLLVIGMFSAAVYGVLEATDPSIKGTDDLPEGATLGLTLLQDGVFILGAWLAVKLSLGRAGPEQFGLRRVSRPLRAVMLAAAAYVGYVVVGWLLTEIFGTPGDQKLVTDIKAEDSLLVLGAYGVLICVIAPVVEELFFRGFMFTVFARRLGVAWAAALVGVIFGLSHAPAPAVSLIALGVFGVALCLLYWGTQSIIPSMALHALNNSITFGLVKSLDPVPFAAVVLLSVGTVVAGATAVSARSTVAA